MTRSNTDYASEARRIHDIGKLTDRHIARATGVAPSTARAWVARTRSPSGRRAERLVELSSVVERLTLVLRPEYIPVWLTKPVAALGDEKPLDVIAAGGYRRVARLIAAMESPTAA
jgi:hypothetical protein